MKKKESLNGDLDRPTYIKKNNGGSGRSLGYEERGREGFYVKHGWIGLDRQHAKGWKGRGETLS